MRQPATILVVDDERAVRMMLEAALRAQGYRVQSVGSGGDARDLLAGEEFDLVMLDLQLGDTDGIEILREIKQAWPATEVILLTAHGSINSAISALRHGAFDYLLKPAQVNDIRERVERGLEQRRTAQQRACAGDDRDGCCGPIAGPAGQLRPDRGWAAAARFAPAWGQLGQPDAFADSHRVRAADRAGAAARHRFEL